MGAVILHNLFLEEFERLEFGIEGVCVSRRALSNATTNWGEKKKDVS